MRVRRSVVLALLAAVGCSKSESGGRTEEVGRLKDSISRLEQALREQEGKVGALRTEVGDLEKTVGGLSSLDAEGFHERVLDVLRDEQRDAGRRWRDAANPGRRRAFLGVVPAELIDEERQRVGIPPGAPGVLLERVLPGMPAERAGLRDGDVLVAVRDREVRDPEQLYDITAEARPGEAMALSFVRAGQPRHTVTATLAEPGLPGGGGGLGFDVNRVIPRILDAAEAWQRAPLRVPDNVQQRLDLDEAQTRALTEAAAAISDALRQRRQRVVAQLQESIRAWQTEPEFIRREAQARLQGRLTEEQLRTLLQALETAVPGPPGRGVREGEERRERPRVEPRPGGEE